MSTRKRKALSIIIFLLILFVVVELSLRVFIPSSYDTEQPLFLADNETCFSNYPNLEARFIQPEFDVVFRTNSLGYRMDEIRNEKHVLILGDSFLFGVTVENNETIPAYLDKEIDGQSINTGVAAFNTAQYLQTLNKTVDRFNFSLAVAFIFLGSDLSTEDRQFYEERHCHLVVEDGRLAKNVTGDPVYNTRKFLTHNFRVFSFVERNIVRRVSGEIPEELILLMKNSTQEIEELYNTEKEIVQSIDVLARQKDKDVLFVLIPTKFQVHEELLDAFAGLYGMDVLQMSKSKPNEVLAEFFESNNMAYLDLLPLLDGFTMENSPYYIQDGHFNPKGNEIVAGLVANKIKELGF